MKKAHIEYLRAKTDGYWKSINNITDQGIKPKALPSTLTATIYELSHPIQLLLGIRNLATANLNFITYRDLSALGLHYRKVEATEFEDGEDHIIYTSNLPPKKLKTFITVWNRKLKMKDEDSDDEIIGELLGYPRCCVKRFVSSEGMLTALFNPNYSFNAIHSAFPFITHRPCSFYCQETRKINREVERALLKICPEIVRRAKSCLRLRTRLERRCDQKTFPC